MLPESASRHGVSGLAWNPPISQTMDFRFASSTLRGIGVRLHGLVPEGRHLPEAVWRRRHLGILVLLWVHAAGIAVFSVVRQFDVGHALLEGGAVAVTALLAGCLPGHRRLRSVLACFGLMTSSALLVHLSGGYIEFHFHFFVMVGLLALYQDWTTFILAIGYVVVHHGLVGVLDPQSVYNHASAWAHPWAWAGIHGAFILAMSAVTLITWRLTEAASALTEVVLESAGEGIVGVDLDGRATFVNAAAARALHCSVEDIVGRPLGPFVLDFPDPDGAVCRLFANLGSGSAAQTAEDMFRTVDGLTFPVEYVSSEIRQHGTVTGAVIAFRDVSRRNAAQVALRESEARLRQSQKMDAIGQLAGGIAHDFNNLLTVIIGRGELLRGRLQREDDRDTVDLITETALRASTLTRQLLVFSRKQVLQPTRVDLRDVVMGMTKMLSRLIGEHIELVTAVDRAAPVWGDVAQIEQVILNLVVNARDAMATGGKLTIAIDTVEGPEPQVVLVVSDTGCGMDEAIQARIFEPFFTTKEPDKGTGLGLATVYGIVQQHNGTISVVSAPRKGSSFRVAFPRTDMPKRAEESPALGPRATGRETVLLVEDDDRLRAVAADSLRMSHYMVIEASTPEQAVRFAATTSIDLLLTDVVMPGMSGPELASLLLRTRPLLRVLFMSGYPDIGPIGQGALEVLGPLLPKPFSARQLTAAVRGALDARTPSLISV